RWATGVWADRFRPSASARTPARGGMREGRNSSPSLQNFRIAAGREKGRHRGPPWNDGDLYKWLEATAAVYAVTKDAALDRRMDEVIRIVARAQRADGYLHTPVLIKNQNGDPTARPFQDRLGFEMYHPRHLF